MRGLLIVVLLAALIGGAFLLLGGGGDDPTIDDTGYEIPENGTDPEPQPEGPLGVHNGDPDGDMLRVDDNGSGTGNGTGSGRPTASFGDAVAVFGTVVDLRDRPLAGATVELRSGPARASRLAGAQASTAEATATTDAAGRFRIGPVQRLPVRIRAFAPGHAAAERTIRSPRVEVTLRLDRGGNLRLKVVDEGGQRVAGARAIFEAGAMAFEAVSDAKGEARLDALPAGEGSLRVLRDEGGAAREPRVAIVPEETVERTVVLPPLSRWAGTVQGEGGKPVKGARVTVIYPKIPEIPAAEPVPTDGKGRFDIPIRVAVGETLELRVEHSEYAERRVMRQFQPQQPLVLSLTPPGPALTGRVVDHATGQGLGGVRVTWWLESGPEKGLPTTSTDSMGRFEIAQPEVAATGWNLAALGPGGALGTAWVRAVAKDQTAPPLVVRLRSGGFIHGKITTPGDAPLARAEVSVEVDVPGTREMRVPGISPWALRLVLQEHEDFKTTTYTDEEGLYELGPLPALAYRISVRHGAGETSDPEPVAVFPEARVTANLVFAPGAGISGTIIDGADEAVPGARVIARRADDGAAAAAQVNGIANSEGTFSLPGANEGIWRLYITAPGYEAKVMESIEGGQRDVEITLNRQGRISGRVVEGGRPFSDAFQIRVRQLGSDTPGLGTSGFGAFHRSQGFQDPDGRFAIDGLGAGEWELEVTTQAGFVSASAKRIRITAGQDMKDVVLELTRGARVTGRVLDAGGKALANVGVTAWATDGRRIDQTRTDASGAFKLEGLPAGKFAIEARPTNAAGFEERVTLTAGAEETVTLRARPTGSIKVRIVDKSDQPLAGAQPRIIDDMGRTHTPNFAALRADGLLPDDLQLAVSTNAAGEVRRYHLPPGSYRVEVLLRGYKLAGEAPRVTVTEGGEAEVTLVLEPS